MSAYPIRPKPEGYPRFNFGLAHDVAQVIQAAGYPPVDGDAFVRLQQALYRFIYGDES